MGQIILDASLSSDIYETKHNISDLKEEIDMKFDTINKALDNGVETITKVYDIVSDPTLPTYKQSWKDLKLYLIHMRDTYYVMKHSFEDKWTNNVFYKFFHYKEYKEYLKNVAMFNYTQTILSRLEELEKENMIINIDEDECNE